MTLVKNAPNNANIKSVSSALLSTDINHHFSTGEVWPFIVNYSKQYGVDPQVVAGVIMQESNFTNFGVHKDGHGHGLIGLDDGGLLPAFEQFLGVKVGTFGRGANAKEIPAEAQVAFVAKVLADGAKKYGDVWTAVRAWNMGDGGKNQPHGYEYENAIKKQMGVLFPDGKSPDAAPVDAPSWGTSGGTQSQGAGSQLETHWGFVFSLDPMAGTSDDKANFGEEGGSGMTLSVIVGNGPDGRQYTVKDGSADPSKTTLRTATEQPKSPSLATTTGALSSFGKTSTASSVQQLSGASSVNVQASVDALPPQQRKTVEAARSFLGADARAIGAPSNVADWNTYAVVATAARAQGQKAPAEMPMPAAIKSQLRAENKWVGPEQLQPGMVASLSEDSRVAMVEAPVYDSKSNKIVGYQTIEGDVRDENGSRRVVRKIRTPQELDGGGFWGLTG